jgi:hypothetical protein
VKDGGRGSRGAEKAGRQLAWATTPSKQVLKISKTNVSHWNQPKKACTCSWTEGQSVEEHHGVKVYFALDQTQRL